MNGSVNKVILIGNLGDNVKIHEFENNSKIGRFPIATSENYTIKETNEKKTVTQWHQIEVRNKLADICDKYLQKGDKVYVEGSINNRKFKGDDGIERYSTSIRVDKIEFLSTKRNQESTDQPTQEDQAE